jgi:hypothetical protein
LEDRRTTVAPCAATWLLQEGDKHFTLQCTSQRPPSLLLEVLLFSSAVVTLCSPVRGAPVLCWRRDWWMAIAVRKLGGIFICASINKSQASRIADYIHGEDWREKRADLLHSYGQQTIYIIKQLFSSLEASEDRQVIVFCASARTCRRRRRSRFFLLGNEQSHLLISGGQFCHLKVKTLNRIGTFVLLLPVPLVGSGMSIENPCSSGIPLSASHVPLQSGFFRVVDPLCILSGRIAYFLSSFPRIL